MLKGWRMFLNTRIGVASLLVAIFALVTSFAEAITIERSDNILTSVDQCTLMVSGIIVKGDAAKISTLIEQDTWLIPNYPRIGDNENYVVCLTGPGGSYLEGIAMAHVFSKFDVATSVPDRASCLSACAVAFLGGRRNFRSGAGYAPSRHLFPDSKLGFHAPQLVIKDGKYSQEAVLAAYKIALDSITELQASARELYIDKDLIRKTVAHRGEDFFYVNTVDDMAYFNITLLGYRERAIEEDTRRAACWNAFHWHYHPDNMRFNSEEWSRVFSDNFNPLGDLRPQGTYVFTPFDGEVICNVTKPDNAPDSGSIQVILSESPDLSDPMVSIYTTPMILMRGNRTLSSTR